MNYKIKFNTAVGRYGKLWLLVKYGSINQQATSIRILS